jgi:uncharacterized coiled-coil DUF342 family protein
VNDYEVLKALVLTFSKWRTAAEMLAEVIAEIRVEANDDLERATRSLTAELADLKATLAELRAALADERSKTLDLPNVLRRRAQVQTGVKPGLE